MQRKPHPATNISHTLLRVNSALLGGMNIPHTHTGYEPNSEIDTGGRFVLIVAVTHDDEDGHSRMSDMPLQLRASANVASFHSASVTFSQAEGDPHAECSKSPFDTDRGKALATTVSPVRTVRVHQQFLDLKKLFNWLHNKHEKL